jgi:hypothetical protein
MPVQRNLKQEDMILGLFRQRSEDPDLPKGLREFNKAQLAQYQQSIARRNRGAAKPPRAFESFLEKLGA